MSLKGRISDAVSAAFAAVGLAENTPLGLQWSSRPEFGDLQINGAMAAAKSTNKNPRELAQQILEKLDLSGLVAKKEIAGPGFINLYIDPLALAIASGELLSDLRLGIELPSQKKKVVVDYSGPNLAKEMHVGHLRSTIIGDAVCRVLECKGHEVVRQNHIGDWGTQFGMLIAELQQDRTTEELNSELSLTDLESFYRQAKRHFDEDPEFADLSRTNVVRLQSGDENSLVLWRQFIKASLSHAEEIYEKLGVSLTTDDARGESAYNDDLQIVVAELLASGIAVEDQGAVVVYLPELADKEGNPSVVIVRKADGGFLYATTDLAALRYRVNQLRADRCLYFIDARQSLHMKQIFAIGRKTGWAPTSLDLEHCAFGTMMGEDGKPFKTRSGDTVKLADLLDEAIERAQAVVTEKNPALDVAEHEAIGRAVGVGAVKYSDLSKVRTNDYRFSWEAMLSFEGNTAPYLLYAGARIHSLFEKAGKNPANFQASIQIVQAEERSLALALQRFSEVIDQIVLSSMPHELCSYLYDLAGKFGGFYENCPILKSDVDEADKNSRLALAALTLKTLETGLGLLGIRTLQRM